jgi:ribosome-binding protein aMBF1 (putative translation factor)
MSFLLPVKQRISSKATREVQPTVRQPKYPRSGKIIREWREHGEVPFSREEVAAKIGRCISTILRWETGQAEPRISHIRQMERIKPGLVDALFAPLN